MELIKDADLDKFKETAEVTNDIKANRKLRIGFIGTGGIARSHVKAYKLFDDVEIAAGADIIPGKARKFFDDWEVPGAHDYTDYREMIAKENLDAVSICTYNRQHAEPAMYAMRHGLDVLLEKPFTVTLDEAVEVCRVEKETGRILSIGFQPRFDPNMQMIKKIFESGVLGKIYYIQTGGGRRRGIPNSTFIEDKTAGIGALGDIGCYSLDMVLNAIGYPKPLTVTGYKSAFFGQDLNYSGYRADKKAEYAKAFKVDDFAAAFIRLEGDIILDFRIAWAMNMDTPGDTIILGTKGGLRIPSTECWNGTVGGPMKIYHEVCGQQVETEIPVITMKKGLFDLKIRTFLDACKNGTPAPVPTSQIIYNQAIIDGIARSAECGHEVEINVPEV